MYEYRAKVASIHDADTLRADIDCGFGIWNVNQPLRLYGLNAHELSTPEGKIARDYLKSVLPLGTEIIVNTIKDAREKYGRYLAIVWLRGANINETLINEGYALPWDGTGVRP